MPDRKRYASTGWLLCSPFRDAVFLFLMLFKMLFFCPFFALLPLKSTCIRTPMFQLVADVPSIRGIHSLSWSLISIPTKLWAEIYGISTGLIVDEMCCTHSGEWVEKGRQGRHRCYLFNCFIVRPLYLASTFSMSATWYLCCLNCCSEANQLAASNALRGWEEQKAGQFYININIQVDSDF